MEPAAQIRNENVTLLRRTLVSRPLIRAACGRITKEERQQHWAFGDKTRGVGGGGG